MKLVLPNLFHVTHFPCSINPHYDRVGAESVAWLESFNLFDRDGPVHDLIKRTDSELLVALTYPTANSEDFRIICDYMNSFFIFDNITDEQDGNAASNSADTYLKALMGEECKQSDTPFYKFLSRFSSHIREKKLTGFLRRFFENHSDYVKAVAREADIRTKKIQLNLDEFVTLRRDTVGIKPCLSLIEFVLEVDLPDDLFKDQAFQNVYLAGVDMIFLVNELHSYKKEYEGGNYWLNMVNILMINEDISAQEAVDRMGQIYESRMKDYTRQMQLIPSFGVDTDRDIHAYLRAIGSWVVGHLEWNFRSKRYFGDENDSVRSSHVVEILKEIP